MAGDTFHSRGKTEAEGTICLPEPPDLGRRRGVRQIVVDESPAVIRGTTESDREALRHFYRGLSKRSQELRLISAERPDDAFVESIYNPPAHAPPVCMLAIQRLGDHSHVVGYASYTREADIHATIEVAIRDDVLKNSIATQLLGQLSSRATQFGIQHFTAIPHATNTEILKVLHQFGFIMRENAGHGYIVVEKWV